MARTGDKCFFCGVETARTLEVVKSDRGAVTTGPPLVVVKSTRIEKIIESSQQRGDDIWFPQKPL